MKSELIAELHIPKRSASRDLSFAIEHNAEITFVDDDQVVEATADLRDSWNQLIRDCERDLALCNDLEAQGVPADERVGIRMGLINQREARLAKLREAENGRANAIEGAGKR